MKKGQYTLFYLITIAGMYFAATATGFPWWLWNL